MCSKSKCKQCKSCNNKQNNLVAKHAHSYNKAATFVDRKKEAKKRGFDYE